MRLAVAIARRVIRRELTVDPQAIQGLLKAALAQIQVQEVNRIRVHPEHEAAVRACLASCGPGTRVEIVGDAGLELGAAVFETDRGNLDASVETQLGKSSVAWPTGLRASLERHRTIDLRASIERMSRIDPMLRSGVVVGLVGLLIESHGPAAASAISVRSGPLTAVRCARR